MKKIDTVEKNLITKIFRKFPYFNNKNIDSNEKKYQYIENFYSKISLIISILTTFLSNFSFLILTRQALRENDEVNISKNKISSKDYNDNKNYQWIFPVQLILNFLIFIFLLFLLFTKKHRIKIFFRFIVFLLIEVFVIFSFFISNYLIKNVILFKNLFILISLNLICNSNFDNRIQKKNALNFSIFKDLFFLLFISTKILQVTISILFNNFEKTFVDFTYEIYIFIFFLLTFLFKYAIGRELRFKLKKLFLEKNYSSKYFQSLINMLNKSFLSFNITLNKINFNLSFLNFLTKLGIHDSDMDFLLNSNLEKKPNKQKYLNLNEINVINHTYCIYRKITIFL